MKKQQNSTQRISNAITTGAASQTKKMNQSTLNVQNEIIQKKENAILRKIYKMLEEKQYKIAEPQHANQENGNQIEINASDGS